MHHFQFSSQKPQDVSTGGYRIRATKSNFPALQNMSIYKLVLNPKAIREPHWHANADELGYCLKGQLIVSFYADENKKETFIISAGDVFLIPQGSLHSIENLGKDTAELVLQFSNEEPEDFGLSMAVGMFTNAVLGNTWAVPSDHFQAIKRPLDETFIAVLNDSSNVDNTNRYLSSYQFSLESTFPLIENNGGSAKVARQNVWPVLIRQAVYSLLLTNKGMREPHWHPETAELGYVRSGKGRMSILSPNGNIDTYVMNEGDIYFVPKAYPHHIENLGPEDLNIVIFFDQPMPQDIGFTGSVKSFSNDVLGAVLHTSSETFAELPIYYEDQFIVKRLNQLDS